MELVLVGAVSLLVLVLSLLFYHFFLSPAKQATPGARPAVDAAKRSKRKVVVLFIDSPDPDNQACAAALYKHVLCSQDESMEKHLHVVLTGRPVDLRTSKSSGVLQLESIPRQSWEKENPQHAERVLCDAAARLKNYLNNSGIDVAMVTIYDGGVAPCAPISDCVHDWDFLFDRKDLATGRDEDRGQILTPEEYSSLVSDISSLSAEEQERKLLSILRPYHLTSLSSLRNKLENELCDVLAFLGGPATAVVELFGGLDGNAFIRSKVVGLFAMFGSQKPGESTLLPNQFNVACDIEAACDLFVANLFGGAEKYLIATETAKNAELVVSSRDLEAAGVGSYFVRLQRLWESTHGGHPQPMFDVFAVMAYLKGYRKCFQWRRKKAVLLELQKRATVQQIFKFADSDDSRHVLVSETRAPQLSRAIVVDFLHQAWSTA